MEAVEVMAALPVGRGLCSCDGTIQGVLRFASFCSFASTCHSATPQDELDGRGCDSTAAVAAQRGAGGSGCGGGRAPAAAGAVRRDLRAHHLPARPPRVVRSSAGHGAPHPHRQRLLQRPVAVFATFPLHACASRVWREQLRGRGDGVSVYILVCWQIAIIKQSRTLAALVV